MLGGVLLQRVIQLLDELALFRGQVHRRLHHHPAEEIATRAATHRLHALVAQAEYPSRLTLCRDLHGHVPIECRHRDAAAERRRGKAHRHLAAQVLAVALEDRVLTHLNFHVQVARGTAVAARLALAAQADPVAGVDARRNLHGQFAAAAHPALAEAGIARVAHERTGAATARAGLLQLKETLADAHLTGTAAGVAGRGLAAFGSATPMAHLALGQARDVDLDLMAEHRLGKLQLQLVAQIRATEHLRAATAAAAAEDVAEHIAEDVAEGIGAEAAPAAAAPGRLDPGMPVLVVGRALVRVGEHLAGLLGFLEGLLRLPIVGITIGVVFHGKASIGLLDLGFSRGLRYVEYLVVIALGHRVLGTLATRILVLLLFELRIDHVVASAGTAARLPSAGGAGAGAGCTGCGALTGRVGTLRDGG